LALIDYNNILQRQPENLMALKGRCEIYCEYSKSQFEYTELALNDLHKIIESEPDNIVARLNRGEIYTWQKKSSLAYGKKNQVWHPLIFLQ